MKPKAKALLAVVSAFLLTLSGSSRADDPAETGEPTLHLPVLGFVAINTARPFTQCSTDMKYVAYRGTIQETATGKTISRSGMCFFSLAGVPCPVIYTQLPLFCQKNFSERHEICARAEGRTDLPKQHGAKLCATESPTNCRGLTWGTYV